MSALFGPNRRARLSLAWVPLLFVACATYSPASFPPGTPSSQVGQSMGKPTGEYRLPDGGRRLEYARGPMGKHTYMLDFDAQDRLVKWEQVLSEANFLTLPPGMTKQELLERVGHPSDAAYYPRLQQQVWSYRYDNPFCLWLQVNMDASDRVTGAGTAPDPLCTDSRSRMR
jgi:hypothetical protein